ncbi:hypothetical protein [Fulvivirga imtechensis]|uniref:hypothetical protein n=1 Tax=Fulvivirga imtechensis TaxID=881893 RepID=UPI0012F90F75|nr:hypothetical protein [Fulvivirga imtechensis]
MTINRMMLAIFGFISILFSCNEDVPRDEIPYATFDDIRISLDLPAYNDLSFDGGYITLSQGVRGIIVYRENASTFHVYERNCSYRPYDACATVNVHSSELYMSDPCCNSSFNFKTGYPTGGPAQFPLRKYRSSLNGRILTIADEPAN